MDPAERAEKQTAQMTEKLSLSDAQAGKVKEINLKYADKMKAAREEADGDWSSMREKMGAMRADQDKELQTVLTEEQWVQWDRYRTEQRANRGGMGRGDQPDGKAAPADTDGGKKAKKGKKKKADSDGSNDQ
jgi:hypothetical protein